MDYIFEELFLKCEVIPIEYDDAVYKRVLDYAKRRADAKSIEKHHLQDNSNEVTRIITGTLGEIALEHILGFNIVDWSIGNSNDYNDPDVPGYRVGIKNVEYGKFPVIFKKNYYPQIICVVKKDLHTVYVCGLATTDVLNQYQTDDLILSPKLKSRGTKTGFFGFEHLIPVRSISDIAKYKEEVYR